MMECEVSSRKILPAIRKELVIELLNLNKKQNEIAEILNVTPAAINQYLKGKRAKIELTSDEKKIVKTLAKLIVNKDEKNEKQLCSLCKKVTKRLNKKTTN